MIAYVGVALGAVLAIGGAFGYGVKVGADGELATQARVEDVRKAAEESAQLAAAAAIAKIKVHNTTVKGEVQREIQTNTVYRDCRLPADGVRLINQALSGPGADNGKLPAAEPVSR